MLGLEYHWFTGWWNLIYLFPLIVAVLYILLFNLAGASFGDTLDPHLWSDNDSDSHSSQRRKKDPLSDSQQEPIIEHDMSMSSAMTPEYDMDIDLDMAVSGLFPLDSPSSNERSSDVMLQSPSTTSKSVTQKSSGPPQVSKQQSLQPWIRLLFWLGAGDLPLSIVFAIFCFGWALIGMSLNVILKVITVNLSAVEEFPDSFLLFDLPFAFLGALYFTKIMGHYLYSYLQSATTH